MSTHPSNRKRPHRAERDTIAAISDRDEMARSARTLIRSGQPSPGSRARVPDVRGRSAKRTVLIGLLAALIPSAVAADLKIDRVGQWGGPANDAVVVGDLVPGKPALTTSFFTRRRISKKKRVV